MPATAIRGWRGIPRTRTTRRPFFRLPLLPSNKTNSPSFDSRGYKIQNASTKDAFRICAAGGNRTPDQSLFLRSWTISSSASAELGASPDLHRGTPRRDSLYTFPNLLVGAWLGIVLAKFPRIHPVFSGSLLNRCPKSSGECSTTELPRHSVFKGRAILEALQSIP